jgi:predicted neuraminidase
MCGSSTEHAGWQVQMEFTRDPLGEWSRTPPLNRADEWGAIQPTILPHGGKVFQILCRSRQQVILESWSHDAGRSWSPLARTPLPNPSSGIDALRLRDGRFLLVYNHAPRGRATLNVALSPDGREWTAACLLEQEPGEFSYPAAIQARDRSVHVTYTWKRQRLRHVVLDPARLEGRPIINGAWPAGDESG